MPLYMYRISSVFIELYCSTGSKCLKYSLPYYSERQMFVPKTNHTAVKIIKLVTCVIQILIYPVKNKRNIGHKNYWVFSVVQYIFLFTSNTICTSSS